MLFCFIGSLTSYGAAFEKLAQNTSKQKAETIERINRLKDLAKIRIAELADQKTTLHNYQMVR